MLRRVLIHSSRQPVGHGHNVTGGEEGGEAEELEGAGELGS